MKNCDQGLENAARGRITKTKEQWQPCHEASSRMRYNNLENTPKKTCADLLHLVFLLNN